MASFVDLLALYAEGTGWLGCLASYHVFSNPGGGVRGGTEGTFFKSALCAVEGTE